MVAGSLENYSKLQTSTKSSKTKKDQHFSCFPKKYNIAVQNTVIRYIVYDEEVCSS